MEQQEKYEAVKNWVDHGGNKNRIAMRFGVTPRTVNRWIVGYRDSGKSFFLHGNTGRTPSFRIDDETRQKIIETYLTTYKDCNFAFFTQMLEKYEDIFVSEQSVRNILEADGIYPCKMWKKRRNRIHREQRAQEKELAKANEAVENTKDAGKENSVSEIQAAPESTTQPIPVTAEKNRIAPGEAHSSRPRCKYFGELIQMDASSYVWFGDTLSHLHVAIDDSLGTIVGAYFDTQETLNGYYHVLKQILLNYGIPVCFLTDRRTVFEYTRTENPDVEKDTFTQFSYACSQLGIEIKTTSVPQAKGRVERLNETLQGRLPFIFRKEGVTDIESANEYLATHLDELYNDELALPIDHTKDVFEKQIGGKEITEETVNLICSVLCTRSLIGQCIRYDKKAWKLLDENGVQQNYDDHTKVTVIKTFDNQLFASVNERRIFKLEEVPVHAEKSKNLDADYSAPKPRKIHIPAMDHPWRFSNFEKHAKSQRHRIELELKNEDAFVEHLKDNVSVGYAIMGHKIA